jgi:alanyl-tRNA synthetase
MTGRLYYADAYLREFDALVSRVERRDGRTAVFLDRTAFYPTSGGQPFDIGTIGDPERVALRVVDVIAEGDEIAHVVDSDQIAAGQQVHGAIDWTRRFDHMQQHTGQHVLSAAADRLFRARTISFTLAPTRRSICRAS